MSVKKTTGPDDERWKKVKRKLFDRYYAFLNEEQRRAVYTVNRPLLVLAGAGSGKTTVLVNRIAHIIRFGNACAYDGRPPQLTEERLQSLEALADAEDADEEELLDALSLFRWEACPPWAILAITFTNKAANEIKSRLAAILGEEAKEIWAGTFHSVCLRILRKYTAESGYRPGFTVYDTEDSKRLIQQCMKQLEVDDKSFPCRSVQNQISRAKDKLLTPEEFAREAGSDTRLKQIARIYALYQKAMQDSNVVDFDDIIMQTVRLFNTCEEARSYFQHRFKYVCVDEYQDTNYAQFQFVRLISGFHNNIMVVGDDDQSIYKFRGATIENILGFDRSFEDVATVKLEQNYRSTKNILGAANGIISHNTERHEKQLWTDNPEGDKIVLRRAENQIDEAKFIINKIMEMVLREKRHYSDFAVLYRANAQSNSLEQVFAKSGVPYRILGGMRFYERKEIKDILAYLCVVNNLNDNLRLRRIINEPKRKIGDATVNAVEQLAELEHTSMFAVMERAEQYPAISRAAAKLREFTELIRGLREIAEHETLPVLIEKTINLTGYRTMLLNEIGDSVDRLENVQELISNAVEYIDQAEEPSLNGFLEETALVADIDNYDAGADAVVMMTIHSAKGLEFPVVFLPGYEDGLFPGAQAILYPDEMEEERRLAYVAITRAKEKLFLIHARERLIYGRTQYNQLSRFASEIPEEFLDVEPKKQRGELPHREKQPKNVMSKEFFRQSDLSANAVKSAMFEHFKVGDRVVHMMFGRGTVLDASEMGSDVLYEIAFDEKGTKKMMATYAKLKRLEE